LVVEFEGGTCPGVRSMSFMCFVIAKKRKNGDIYRKKNRSQMNEEIGFKRTVECTKITDLRNSGIFLYKVGTLHDKIRRRSADTGAETLVS